MISLSVMMSDDLLPGDLLIGAAAIAKALGVKRRQIYHLIYINEIPTFKIGGNIVARRSTLARWLEEKEREG